MYLSSRGNGESMEVEEADREKDGGRGGAGRGGGLQETKGAKRGIGVDIQKSSRPVS